MDLSLPTDVQDATLVQEALMQFLYQAPIGLVRTTLAGTVEMMNPAAAQLLMPLAPGGDLGNLFAVLQPWAPELAAQVAAFSAPSGAVGEPLRLTLSGGGGQAAAGARVLGLSLMKLAGMGLMATLSDITLDVRREQQGLDRRLRAAERTDALTRMPNRAALREQITATIARRTVGGQDAFAVLFINGDRFRQINDLVGQDAGDVVLGLMAERLRGVLRTVDHVGVVPGLVPGLGEGAIAARTGGDEFVIVLDHLVHADDVHAVAQRLVDTLGQPYAVGDQLLRCGASIGVVLPAQCSDDADAVLRDAGIAMVEAKRAGGGRYRVFEPAMRERAALRDSLESELHRALAEGQLFVEYQPVLDLRCAGGTRVADVAVEALVRWRHPQRGVVPPLAFIAVAEECGLIGALGDFVLRTACRQFTAWQQALGAAAPVRLAVNLSRAQLRQADWVDTVRAILADAGMAADRLQLEVTESLAAQDEQVCQRLQALKALGISLALDDFGTGYSSLSSLHQLPVDTVKIDRSFVSQSATSQHHRVLIEATVRVANSLGMATVAEGIETDDQLQVVCTLGCDKAQGYLFSRPLPAEALARWLTERAGALDDATGRTSPGPG